MTCAAFRAPTGSTGREFAATRGRRTTPARPPEDRQDTPQRSVSGNRQRLLGIEPRPHRGKCLRGYENRHNTSVAALNVLTPAVEAAVKPKRRSRRTASG
jgi:hypothetical protein